MSDILTRFEAVRQAGDGWSARCPGHEDQTNSLSIHHRDGKWLLRCHAGCKTEDVVAAVDLTMADLFDDKAGGWCQPLRLRCSGL